MGKTVFESAALEELFSQCFQGGERRQRELRLTAVQAEALRSCYPVIVRSLGSGWYDILLLAPHDNK